MNKIKNKIMVKNPFYFYFYVFSNEPFCPGPRVVLRGRAGGPGGGPEEVLHAALSEDVHRTQLTVHVRPTVSHIHSAFFNPNLLS